MAGDDRYWNAEQAATYVGLSPSKVRQLARVNGIPNIRLGGKRVYERDQLDRWLDARRVRAEDVVSS